MLAKRIIPCLDVERGRVVKGTQFLDLVDAGDPVEVAARYEAEGADELVFLDITASHEGRAIMLDVVRRVSETIFMPFTVGGGIRTLDDAAPARAGRRREGEHQLGGRAHAGARHRRGRPARQLRHGGQHRPQAGACGTAARSGRCSSTAAACPPASRRWPGPGEVERLGAGEIVLTCMDRDGTRDGYDLEITAAVSRAVGIPVVASGGAGRPEHLADAIERGGADAALAAGIFHFGQCTIREVKELFLRRGIPVRPPRDSDARRHAPHVAAMATTEPPAAESAPPRRSIGAKGPAAASRSTGSSRRWSSSRAATCTSRSASRRSCG